MKVLKIILIILGVIVAVMLIVPLFAPATVTVNVEKEIDVHPEQLFPMVASFAQREAWDPWVEMDTTTIVTVLPAEGYVGSTYQWEGERLGTGRMEVLSVVENEYIQSHLWFGDVPEPSVVEWSFEPVEGGTRVTWSFSEETTYPFERLRMMIGKMFLEQSFEQGLTNLEEYMENRPPEASMLGPVSIATQPGFTAIGVRSSGTMEEIGGDMERIFELVMGEVERQELQVTGPPFTHYADWDENSGISNYLGGIPVSSMAQASGEVIPVEYPAKRVLQAIHSGSYEELGSSYERLMAHAAASGLELIEEAFEFYLTDPMAETDPSRWKTRITLVLAGDGP